MLYYWLKEVKRCIEGLKNIFQEFEKFAMRGNVVDMAVGIVIGAAFGAIANSLVSDVIMPPVGLLLSEVDFSDLFIVLKHGTTPGPYCTIAEATKSGAVTLNYGKFVNTIISFLIPAIAVFLLVRYINKLESLRTTTRLAPTTKRCQYCFTTISIKAIRCPNCTSVLTKS